MLFGHEDELSLSIRLKNGEMGNDDLESEFIGKMLSVLVKKHQATPFGIYRAPGDKFPAAELFSGKINIGKDVFKALVHRGVYLPNLGRIYEEAVRPYFEVSTITATDPFELYKLTRRGQQIAGYLSKEVSDDEHEVKCFNAASDRKGRSAGMHLNYCVSREYFIRLYSRKFDRLAEDSTDIAVYSREAQDLMAFRVLMTILRGAGKVGSELWSEKNPAHYQISERSDSVSRLLNSATSADRPIINFRDEPHADPQWYARLHVINGEGNRSPWAFAFDAGLLAIFLKAQSEEAIHLPWRLNNPVEDLWNLSRDLNLEREIPVYHRERRVMISGKPLDLLEQMLFELYKFIGSARLPAWCDRLVAEARRVVALLARGELDEPTTMLDWLMKKRFLENYMKKLGLNPESPASFLHPRVQQLDLHYHRMDADGWKIFAEYSGARDFDKYWLPYGTPADAAFWRSGMPKHGRPHLFARLLRDKFLRDRVSVLDWERFALWDDSAGGSELVTVTNPYIFGREHLKRLLAGKTDFRERENRENLIARLNELSSEEGRRMGQRFRSVFEAGGEDERDRGEIGHWREIPEQYRVYAERRPVAPRVLFEESGDIYERSLGILVPADVPESKGENGPEAERPGPVVSGRRFCSFDPSLTSRLRTPML